MNVAPEEVLNVQRKIQVKQYKIIRYTLRFIRVYSFLKPVYTKLPIVEET